MPRIPRRDEDHENDQEDRDGGQPQAELARHGAADDSSVTQEAPQHDDGTPAGGEEGVRDAGREEGARENYVRAGDGGTAEGARRGGSIQDLIAGRSDEDRDRVSVVNEPHGDPDDEYR